MANSKSAIKRARQAQKRYLHNRSQRSRLKTAIKRVLTAESPEQAEQALRETSAILDRFAVRRLIHRNKAARKKSQLARRVAALRAQASSNT
ncbi:MAG TPA: 30S ribosomal protein S20 [Longimicrobiales bacterium]|nr:30S ribosomal protein S20 [Longimicrobiales bacterium]